jgi:hypothetical protein
MNLKPSGFWIVNRFTSCVTDSTETIFYNMICLFIRVSTTQIRYSFQSNIYTFFFLLVNRFIKSIKVASSYKFCWLLIQVVLLLLKL